MTIVMVGTPLRHFPRFRPPPPLQPSSSSPPPPNYRQVGSVCVCDVGLAPKHPKETNGQSVGIN